MEKLNRSRTAVLPIENPGQDKLSMWFSLSYASFAVMPRAFMEAMPDEWKLRMAALLEEWDEEWDWSRVDEVIGTRVQMVDKNNRLIKTPDWMKNYRRPDRFAIESIRRKK